MILNYFNNISYKLGGKITIYLFLFYIPLVLTGYYLLDFKDSFFLLGLLIGVIIAFLKFSLKDFLYSKLFADNSKETVLKFFLEILATFSLMLFFAQLSLFLFTGFVSGLLIIPFSICFMGIKNIRLRRNAV